MKQPHEYPEMCREAAIARVGADRMAAGLSCIPDPVRGDLDMVERLRAAFLGYLQTENECARTGQPCRTGGTCGCALEMQGYVLADEQGLNNVKD